MRSKSNWEGLLDKLQITKGSQFECNRLKTVLSQCIKTNFNFNSHVFGNKSKKYDERETGKYSQSKNCYVLVSRIFNFE